jgi:FAD synthase
VLHLSEDLYGHEMTVQFFQRLRDEQRFDNEDALVRQLQLDAQQVENLFKKK